MQLIASPLQDQEHTYLHSTCTHPSTVLGIECPQMLKHTRRYIHAYMHTLAAMYTHEMVVRRTGEAAETDGLKSSCRGREDIWKEFFKGSCFRLRDWFMVQFGSLDRENGTRGLTAVEKVRFNSISVADFSTLSFSSMVVHWPLNVSALLWWTFPWRWRTGAQQANRSPLRVSQ